MAICSPEVNWRVVLGGIFHDIFSSLVHFRSKTPFDSGREYPTTLISCARADENDLKTTQANLSMALPA
jgi:hypothetical protein